MHPRDEAVMKIHKKLFSGIPINFTIFGISPKLQRIWSWNFGFAIRKIWAFIWYQKYTTSSWALGDENVIGIRAFNLSVMFFPKFAYMTKTHPFLPILHVFAPLNDVRTYSAWSWKTTLITWIFGRAWYPLDIRVAPWAYLFTKRSFYATCNEALNFQG